MDNEYEGFADIDGERTPVTCYYELDGYKPLGLYICNPEGVDITECVPESEYDRLYMEACDDIAGTMADAADMVAGMER